MLDVLFNGVERDLKPPVFVNEERGRHAVHVVALGFGALLEDDPEERVEASTSSS